MLHIARIALRNVARNRRRSLITLAAIFLGVGVMLFSRGMLNGLQGAVREETIFGQVGALQVHRAGYMKAVLAAPLSLAFPVDEALLARIRSLPHVVGVAPRIQFGAMVNAGETTVFALLSGMDPRNEPVVTPRREQMMAAGRLLQPGDDHGAVFSQELARRLGLSTGGQGAVLSADRDGVLNGVEVRLSGLLGPGGAPQADTKLAFLPLALVQELLRMPGSATEVAVGVDDLANLEATQAALAQALGPEFEVSSWHDLVSFVDDVIAIQNVVLSSISGIFLFIALLGIANTMLMNVLERTREIGTMMAVGVRRRQILTLFLNESVVLALVGSLAGAGLAALLIERMHGPGLSFTGPGGGAFYLHPYLTWSYSALIVGLACAGAALAALYPAWKASRMRPIEALSRI